MIYVDEAVWPYRGMLMCHLLADTVEELHAMADAIGMKRRWFQNDKYPHYDICKTKRALAVKAGAKEIGRREFVDLANKQRHSAKRAAETGGPADGGAGARRQEQTESGGPER